MELLLGEKGELIFTGFNVIFCGDTEKLLFFIYSCNIAVDGWKK
ncbi:hypothetical protein SE18013_46200 [Escherichia coli O157:H7]|nr:hypothetical protein SE18013_46200 [Escherichia coli O157:H7]